jgi:PhzF family phenazine biosynthesis protein
MSVVRIVNAFTKNGLGGNGAGVMLDAGGLSDAEKLSISARVGLAETAFVEPSDVADFRVTFFTPAAEVDLCGHATIATFAYLLASGAITPGRYTQETLAGILAVEVAADGIVMMMQNPPVFSQAPDPQEIARSLGIGTDGLDANLPIRVVSTGLRDILVPVRTAAILDAIVPDFEMISHASREYDTIGYHVFTLDAPYGGAAYCRNFAPLYDVPEEAATGTSSGALACYLRKYSPVHASGCEFVFDQGYVLGAPSEILARFDDDGRIWVGGRACPSRTISLDSANE